MSCQAAAVFFMALSVVLGSLCCYLGGVIFIQAKQIKAQEQLIVKMVDEARLTEPRHGGTPSPTPKTMWD